MSTATELRRQVESALSARFPAALSVRPPTPPELLSCGIAEVDAVLCGGLPLGAITELTGADSSGRTSLVMTTLSEVTRCGESCAYVDGSDALDPISAAAAEVDLSRLLWVRAGESQSERGQAKMADVNSCISSRLTPLPPQELAADTVSPYVSAAPVLMAESKHIGGRGWFHPRNETNGLDQALGKLFQSVHHEQNDFTPRCAEAKRRPPLQSVMVAPVTLALQKPNHTPKTSRVLRKRAWTQLDQALRATDLLLNAGGFRAIVLDMGDVAPEQAQRVPLATWYRFRLQAEKSRTLFLLITRVPCAHSCAAVSLHFQQGAVDWQQSASQSPKLLSGTRYRVRVEHSRKADPTRKKPAVFATASWNSRVQWSR